MINGSQMRRVKTKLICVEQTVNTLQSIHGQCFTFESHGDLKNQLMEFQVRVCVCVCINTHTSFYSFFP